MIHINKHLQRSWYNKSKGLLKLLVIKQKWTLKINYEPIAS
jgi:hypothetical protein